MQAPVYILKPTTHNIVQIWDSMYFKRRHCYCLYKL